MYATHQPKIAAYARLNADNFARVLTFCVLSAHMPFDRLKYDLAEVDRMGPAAGCLFGWKSRAVREIQDRKATLFQNAEELCHNPDALLEYLTYGVYGLGLVKAGFACQLIYGVSGCVDTHNLQRFGLAYGTFAPRKASSKRMATRERRARDYNSFVEAHGGTEGLWNSWCAWLAAKSPARWQTAHRVSEFHCTILGV